MLVEIALDETEVPMNMDLRNETCHMVVLHATVTAIAPNGVHKFEVAIPPAAVQSTAAAHLFASCVLRLPFALDTLSLRAEKVIVF
jgi:hypothetical protein